MLQASIDDTEVEPGHVYEWRLTAPRMRGGGSGAGRRTTGYNQVKHFAVAQHTHDAGETVPTYVATTFELPGPVELDALGAALLHFVRRHEVLRCRYRTSAGDLIGEALDPDDIELKLVDVGRLDSADEVRAYLHEFFQGVDPLGWPLIVMGAVVREASATVHLSWDHLVTDGLSNPLAVRDIATAYTAYARNEQPELPQAGSYLDFSREERELNRALTADDERLEHWRGFMARSGDFFPRFPLDLGTRPGRFYPTAHDTVTLLDDAATAALETRCQEAGGKLFTGLLAAVGVAIREQGGPDVYRGLMPINERGRGTYAHSVGWFINTVPIEFPVPEGTDLPDLLAHVHAAVDLQGRYSDVHFVKAWRLLSPAEYASMHYWPHAVNFFSYSDYRRSPGAEHHTTWRPRLHVWLERHNGIILWLHRNDTGLHLNSAYVDTVVARRTKADLVSALVRTLTNIVRSGRL
ncbi:condensation domain-containing protein [Kitasatospora sp. NPDC052868]|uniref:condensation domain-containing protein n=1 Tax=Kitasatospora sp. NPDC052868 TaxID=3364060 RepID=UPI0037CA6551